jgi:hypothetical protein
MLQVAPLLKLLQDLTSNDSPDVEYRDKFQPDEVTTTVHIDGDEQLIGTTPWANIWKLKHVQRSAII